MNSSDPSASCACRLPGRRLGRPSKRQQATMKASLARSVEEMDDDGAVWGRATMKRFSQEIVASNSPQSRRPAAGLLRQPPAAAAAGLHARAPAVYE